MSKKKGRRPAQSMGGVGGISSRHLRMSVRKLSRSNNHLLAVDGEDTNTEILKVGEGSTARYYLVDHNNRLGKGATGTVCVAHRINPKTGIQAKSAVAVKVLSESRRKEIENEVRIQSQYHKTEPIVEANGKIYVVTEKIPGKTITNDSGAISQDLLKFDLDQRVHLITSLLARLSELHHTTPSSGGAIVHADLKGANLLYSMDNDNKPIASPIDFGESMALEYTQELQVQSAEGVRGTPDYIAPEIFNGKVYSAKSDIYAITATVAMILGEPETLKNKSASYKGAMNELDQLKFSQSKFCVDNVDIDDAEVKRSVVMFLNRMQSYSVSRRPGTSECLKFFTTLHNLQANSSLDSPDPDRYEVYTARLRVLAHNTLQDDSLDITNITEPAEARAINIRLGIMSKDDNYDSVCDRIDILIDRMGALDLAIDSLKELNYKPEKELGVMERITLRSPGYDRKLGALIAERDEAGSEIAELSIKRSLCEVALKQANQDVAKMISYKDYAYEFLRKTDPVFIKQLFVDRLDNYRKQLLDTPAGGSTWRSAASRQTKIVVAIKLLSDFIKKTESGAGGIKMSSDVTSYSINKHIRSSIRADPVLAEIIANHLPYSMDKPNREVAIDWVRSMQKETPRSSRLPDPARAIPVSRRRTTRLGRKVKPSSEGGGPEFKKR